jgi:hypothetical protein
MCCSMSHLSMDPQPRYAMDELRQALRRDPQACLLHNFARTYFLAVLNRPLLRGFLLDDPHLLGKLTNATDTARDDRHAAMARDYLGLLAEHGLLRDDMRLDEIGYAYQATLEGFLRADGAARARSGTAGGSARSNGPARLRKRPADPRGRIAGSRFRHGRLARRPDRRRSHRLRCPRAG